MALIVGILLAAGASRRFGADKLNHPLSDGDSVAVHACRALLRGTDLVCAVVRPGNPTLVAQLQAEGAQVQLCQAADEGMGTSLAFGVSRFPTASGWVVALADMPWIAPATIHKIAEAIRLGACIAAPTWQGQRGHPVGFAQVLGNDLAALRGDVGAKSIIHANQQKLQLLDCNDPGVVQDIDTPEDLQTLLSGKRRR